MYLKILSDIQFSIILSRKDLVKIRMNLFISLLALLLFSLPRSTYNYVKKREKITGGKRFVSLLRCTAKSGEGNYEDRRLIQTERGGGEGRDEEGSV